MIMLKMYTQITKYIPAQLSHVYAPSRDTWLIIFFLRLDNNFTFPLFNIYYSQIKLSFFLPDMLVNQSFFVDLGDLFVIISYYIWLTTRIFISYWSDLNPICNKQCLSIVPVEIFRWVIAGAAGFMSATFVALNLRSHIVSAGERWFLIVAGIFLLQSGLAVILKLYFFTITVGDE